MTIPYAAMSETSSNCWKFSVISEAIFSECTVDRPAKTYSIADRKSWNVGW
jgi:hypothetical protein